jgi:ATP-binding cassette subfamily B multidrug efflux pump
VLGFFEKLVDPYVAYPQRDRPPQRLWPFLKEYSLPFRKVFAVAAGLSVVVAMIEVGLIWYMGRVVDILGTAAPAEVQPNFPPLLSPHTQTGS